MPALKLFCRYLEYRRSLLLLGTVCFGLSAAIFALYGLPVSPLFYVLTICLGLGLVFAAADFWLFYRRHRELTNLRETVKVDPNLLPAPADLLEEDWCAIIRSLSRHKQQQLDTAASSARRLTNYYTIWGHQIKTPIAALRLNLQADLPPQPTELLEKLQEVEQYVDMLLTYQHLEGEASDYVIRETPLDELVQQALRKFAPQFIRRRLQLVYEPSGQTVLTDAKWLLFVIEQLLSNALKYTRQGSITISLAPPLTLCITDTGIGIAPEDLPRIFEQGFTGQNGRAHRQGAQASGIGLYLCRRICQGLGHRLTISSTPGLGTTVRLDMQTQPFTPE